MSSLLLSKKILEKNNQIGIKYNLLQCIENKDFVVIK